MAWVPSDAKWWIAEIIQEITVEGDPRNVVHVNFVLVRADSPDQAYERALQLGRDGDAEYANSAGQMVRIRFQGLRDLKVMYDELEDGAELIFEEYVSKPIMDFQIRSKNQLSVFTGWKPPDCNAAPDYGAKEIIDEVERRFGIKRFGTTKDED